MRQRIDVKAVNASVNLLALLSPLTTLRRAASTGGGEWCGPCPFCAEHGRDRFRVQPNQKPWGIWMCRYCTGGVWQDPLELAARLWPSLTFRERCERLTGNLDGLQAPPPASILPRAEHPSGPPSLEWQAAARQTVETCEAALWQPENARVLNYLTSRGLQEKTIRHFHLGYCSTGEANAFGRDLNGLWVPRGILIPWTLGREMWSLKVRLVPGLPCRCSSCKTVMLEPGRCPNCGSVAKYLAVAGSQARSIFNADRLADLDIALFTEGEFDCMLAHQELNDILPVATLGSAASDLPDLARWGRYFTDKKAIFLAYDGDEAGRQGVRRLWKQCPRFISINLPDGCKDITEFHQAGGDLWKWIKPYLNQHDPLEGEWARLLEMLEHEGK